MLATSFAVMIGSRSMMQADARADPQPRRGGRGRRHGDEQVVGVDVVTGSGRPLGCGVGARGRDVRVLGEVQRVVPALLDEAREPPGSRASCVAKTARPVCMRASLGRPAPPVVPRDLTGSPQAGLADPADGGAHDLLHVRRRAGAGAAPSAWPRPALARPGQDLRPRVGTPRAARRPRRRRPAVSLEPHDRRLVERVLRRGGPRGQRELEGAGSSARWTRAASSPSTSRRSRCGSWASPHACSGSRASRCCCPRRCARSARSASCTRPSGGSSGRRPGCSPAAALAITPVTVAIARVNNPDALLVACSSRPPGCSCRALQSGRTKHLGLVRAPSSAWRS